MNDSLVSQIQRFTLEARHELERETSEQLEGIYGWLPDGTFAKVSLYPALNQLEEARETRRRLEAYTVAEKEAGFDTKAARRKLVREAAFTWLNRLVALRMMEERKLIRETVSRLSDSNAYKFWLADGHDPDALKLHEQGETPPNTMGEAPRHIAYRRFLLWQCGDISREVSVLFDPNTLASRLCPRPNLLKALIVSMSADDLVEAWLPGNEETVGWVYQAFCAEELQAAFAGAREQGKKFNPEDIPAVTQLFTIRWVVRYLVENTLGRLWLEMHPESRLRDKLGYLVPSPKDANQPCKLVCNITFLDPACGSMHFGLVAFDLFAEMYREEIENAGKVGWPEKPSVPTIDDIPAAIITHNLHGIDLDLRAVQLSALTLFLRARTMNLKCAFTDRNLACANVEQLTGGRLDEFIGQSRFSHPIYDRILRQLALLLKDSDNMGSLLRPEKMLETLIEEERRKAGKAHLVLPGFSPEQFETEEGLEEFFDILQEQILRYLDLFAKKSRGNGVDPSHFAAEAAKGLRFVRLVQQRYDVVTTNPPYLSNRKMNARLKSLLEEDYAAAKGDLYAAFILRCKELLDASGLMGMLTMHSFMFISSYEDLRAKLRKEVSIETLAHFGGGLFAVGNPGTLQTAAFVFRKERDEVQRDENVGAYLRLVRERDSEAKRVAFESALSASKAGQSHPVVFTYRQKDYNAIPGKPWVYWITPSLRDIFIKFPLLESVADWRRGLSTADNKRFIRFWWEIGLTRIGLGCQSQDECYKRPEKWFPLAKGGSFQRWYGNQSYCINYGQNAKELKAWLDPLYNNSGWSRMIKSPELYFHPAITYSAVTSFMFSARLTPVGFVFDQASNAIFTRNQTQTLLNLLAVLNSKLTAWILTLNPTVNIVKDDIYRIPVPSGPMQNISILAEKVLVKAKNNISKLEIALDFQRPYLNLREQAVNLEELANIEDQINHEIYKLYDLSEKDQKAIADEVLTPAIESGEEQQVELLGEDEEESAIHDLAPAEWARSWISYTVGCLIGRFEIGVQEGLGCGDFSQKIVSVLKGMRVSDGILVNDSGQPLDLADRVWQALVVMLSKEEACACINTALGEGEPLALMRGWFDRFAGQPGTSFWKYHFQLYRKRPVYWPLQSPKREYTVWVFHERITKDTLFHIRNNIVEPRLRLAERQITDLKSKADKDRRARKELDQQRDLADDLREFSKRLKAITDRGYTPRIDDGVLLNAAPLYEILPSWPETKKAWQELESGDYDWALQAMEYCPGG